MFEINSYVGTSAQIFCHCHCPIHCSLLQESHGTFDHPILILSSRPRVKTNTRLMNFSVAATTLRNSMSDNVKSAGSLIRF